MRYNICPDWTLTGLKTPQKSFFIHFMKEVLTGGALTVAVERKRISATTTTSPPPELGHMMQQALMLSVKELVEHSDSRADRAIHPGTWTHHACSTQCSADKHVSDELRLKVDLLDGKCQEFFPIILRDLSLKILTSLVTFWMIGDKNLLQVCLQILSP